MHLQKGICIEVNDNRSIFLTADGEFIQGTAVNETAVGEEGYFQPLASKKIIGWKSVWVPVLAAIAVLAMVFSVIAPSGEAYAYVQVQINPGVEIGVNEECQVISLRKLNEDGNKLIEKLGDWKNQPLDVILHQIVKHSLTESTEEMTITTVAEENRDNANLLIESMIMAISADAIKNNVDVRLKKATKKQWRKSVKEDVPVGEFIKEFKSINPKNEPLPERSDERSKEEKNKDAAGVKKDLPVSKSKADAPPSEKQKEDKEPKKAVPASPKTKPNPPAVKEEKAVPPGQQTKPPTAKHQNKQKTTPPGQTKKKPAAPAKAEQKEKPLPPGKLKQKEKPQPPGKAKQKEKPKPPGKEKKKEKPKPPSKEKPPKKAGPPGQEKQKNASNNRHEKNGEPKKEKTKGGKNE